MVSIQTKREDFSSRDPVQDVKYLAERITWRAGARAEAQGEGQQGHQPEADRQAAARRYPGAR